MTTLDISVAMRFEEMVERHGGNIAATDGDQTITYAVLNNAANAVAHAILQTPHPGDTPAAMLSAHDLPSIISVVGIVKSGRPYVALDAATPPDRLQRMLTSAGADCLISSRALQPLVEELRGVQSALRVIYLEDLDLKAPAANPGIQPPPEFPFAIFYTAGSTGEPKGLVHLHRGLSFYARDQIEHFRLAPSDRLSLFTHVHLGGSYTMVFGALTSGSTVCLYQVGKRTPKEALEWIQQQGITFLRATPSLFRALFEAAPAGFVLESVRVVRLGGEPARASDFELFKAHTPPRAMFVHTFGSTDATSIASLTLDHSSKVEAGDLPMGYPAPFKEVTLVDEEGEPVAMGEAGEIVVRSPYMSAGYWRQPALSARVFRPDPDHPAETVLFTGDMARWRPDGMLEFVGRKDFMVKIRGQRVELPGVERRLLEHPAVRDVVVTARPSRLRPDQLQMVAYVVLQEGMAASTRELRAHLASALPDYMVPAHFVGLEALPLNLHGKVDRRALPEPAERTELAGADMPADDIEQRLVEIWRLSLKSERVGVQDNFFESGGDSLSVLSMMLEVEQAFGRVVPQTFFREPTIRGLAALLREEQPHAAEQAGAFRLEGHREPGTGRPVRLPGAIARSTFRVRRWARELRRTRDVGYYFEALLAPSLMKMDFRDAVLRLRRLAKKPWVQNLVYRPQRALFLRFAASMGLRSSEVLPRFGSNVAANLAMKLEQARPPLQGSEHSRLRRERARVMQHLPPDELDEHYPVQGYEYLEAALKSGRGAILVSMHGTAFFADAIRMLARRAGLDKIPTIAQRKPLEQSYLWGSGIGQNAPADVTSALQAEIAFHGQQLLRQGRIVHVSPDVISYKGGTHRLVIGDRVYSMRSGFPELALNTGASVVPVFGRFLEDSRLLTEFLPPLEAGEGTREQQVEALLNAYAAFVTDVSRRMPEIILWKKMRNHLKWPRVPTA